eukprot:5047880-Ditylum_brightwellii.AAC.1
MPKIIHKASENIVQCISSTQSPSTVTTLSLQLTEPQVVPAMTEVMSELQLESMLKSTTPLIIVTKTH